MTPAPAKLEDVRHRLKVMAKSPPAPNEFGEPVAAESALAEVWAAVNPSGGAEAWRGNKAEAETSYTVVIRFFAPLTTAHWFIWKGKRLELDSVTDVGGLGEWMVCNCRHVEVG